MKRLIALLLCLATLICVFAACAKKNEDEEEDPGAYVRMYLSEPIYNFDPAFAYKNEAALKVVSLMYENLFVLTENGKVEKSLVDSYKIDKEKNTMTLKLRKDASWTDGTAVSSYDIVTAWGRILDASNSFDAAVLLYDIKNARACKEGDIPSFDDVGVKAHNSSELEIEFEEGVDYDQFLLNLTSYALAPLRSDVLERTAVANDWAKTTTTLVTSGPFRLRQIVYDQNPDDPSKTPGLILERNPYYRRDFMEDKIDKSVNIYRLMIDYTKTGEEIYAAYQAGEIFYLGDLPLSVRSQKTLEEWSKDGEVTDAMSTHTYVFNVNAEINGEKLFARKEVRQALSMAIDRTEISNAIVFAEPANGIVPNGVFNASSHNKTFRGEAEGGLALTADTAAASALLSTAGVTPSKYSFAISVPAYDEVHLAIAEKVKAAWCALGFKVTVNAIANINNPDKALTTNEVIPGVKDDMFVDAFSAGNFEVAAVDQTAYSADAFSYLAAFAKGYSGGASHTAQSSDFFIATHISGYDSEAYNAKIDAAYAEKDIEARATLLHEAEAILMEELPVIPIVYNKHVALCSKDFSKIEVNYYGAPDFRDAKLKDYELYIPEEEKKKEEEEAA